MILQGKHARLMFCLEHMNFTGYSKLCLLQTTHLWRISFVHALSCNIIIFFFAIDLLWSTSPFKCSIWQHVCRFNCVYYRRPRSAFRTVSCMLPIQVYLFCNRRLGLHTGTSLLHNGYSLLLASKHDAWWVDCGRRSRKDHESQAYANHQLSLCTIRSHHLVHWIS